MNDQHAVPNHPDVVRLLDELCDGTLSPNGLAQLKDILASSAVALDYYIDRLHLEASLLWDFSPIPSEIRLATAGRALAEVPELPQSLPAVELRSRPSRRRLAWQAAYDIASNYITLSLLISTITMAIIVLSMGLIVLDSKPSSPVRPDLTFVARISAVHEVTWGADSDGNFNDVDLFAGERLVLTSGLAELTFKSGARLVLEGPVELQVKDTNRGELLDGKVVAYVPPAAVGYILGTPDLKIVDLGTEFGAVVDEHGTTDVLVFEGEIAVSPNAATETQSVTNLLAGERVRFTPDGQAKTGIASTNFADTFVRKIDRETVIGRRYHPHAINYWNCDKPGQTVRDSVGQRPGELEGAASIDAGLVDRGAVRFSGRRPAGVRFPQSKLLLEDGLTIELMVSTEWNGDSLQNLVRKEDAAERILLAIQPAEHMTAPFVQGDAKAAGVSFGINVDGEYIELDVPLDGIDGRPRLADFNDGQPHHIVATHDVASGIQKIYLDGQEIGRLQRPAGGPIITTGVAPLYWGSRSGQTELFAGLMDEVVIYNQALTAAEVKQHWQKARQNASYFEK